MVLVQLVQNVLELGVQCKEHECISQSEVQSATGKQCDCQLLPVSGYNFLAERVTLLLLLKPASSWPAEKEWGSDELAWEWRSLTDISAFTIVATEVDLNFLLWCYLLCCSYSSLLRWLIFENNLSMLIK